MERESDNAIWLGVTGPRVGLFDWSAMEWPETDLAAIFKISLRQEALVLSAGCLRAVRICPFPLAGAVAVEQLRRLSG